MLTTVGSVSKADFEGERDARFGWGLLRSQAADGDHTRAALLPTASSPTLRPPPPNPSQSRPPPHTRTRTHQPASTRSTATRTTTSPWPKVREGSFFFGLCRPQRLGRGPAVVLWRARALAPSCPHTDSFPPPPAKPTQKPSRRPLLRRHPGHGRPARRAQVHPRVRQGRARRGRRRRRGGARQAPRAAVRVFSGGGCCRAPPFFPLFSFF
jgi:hypothetical protein